MFIQNKQEFKQTTSALRKGILELFPGHKLSHAQCLELLAQALGKSSYAELLTVLPAEERTPTPQAVPARYPLRNVDGVLDLVERGKDGQVVSGRSFTAAEGTVEDISYCVSFSTSASRILKARLTPSYEGDTRINWDGQTTRRDANGTALWHFEDGEARSELDCILVPEGFEPFADAEELLQVPCREVLLQAYLDVARERACDKELFEQVQDEGLASALLDAIGDVVGFALHHGELAQLESRLKALR